MEPSQFAATENLTEKENNLRKIKYLRHLFYYNCPRISDLAISEYKIYGAKEELGGQGEAEHTHLWKNI